MITINNINIEQEFQQLLFLGDIHGQEQWERIRWAIKLNDLRNVCIVQVGDFGIGFKTFGKESRALKSINLFLKKRDIKLLIIRGNHDDPKFFKNDLFELSNISFIADYSILSINLLGDIKRIFCLGGAISIDRMMLKKNVSWFEDEVVQWTDDMSILNQIKDINIIVTHTSPDFVWPYVMGPLVDMFAQDDKYLKLELIRERQLLGNMMNYIIKANPTLTHYYHGHFHQHHKDLYNDVKFECLAIDQFGEYKINA